MHAAYLCDFERNGVRKFWQQMQNGDTVPINMTAFTMLIERTRNVPGD